MSIYRSFLSTVLLTVFSGCWGGPTIPEDGGDPCNDCADWGLLVDACLEEWKAEFNVTPDCFDSLQVEWYDEWGNLRWDKEGVWDAYMEVVRVCESGDDAYESCNLRMDVERDAASLAGNLKEREESCVEDSIPGAEAAMKALDCTGYLLAHRFEPVK